MSLIDENAWGGKFYLRESDKKQIGDIYLSRIEYWFFNGKVFMVVLKSNAENRTDLIELFVEKYGKYDRDRNLVSWTGKRIHVTCINGESSLTVYLSYRPINKKYEDASSKFQSDKKEKALNDL